MFDSTLVSKFRKQIQEDIADRRHSVSEGLLTDIAGYRDLCGQIRGLENALNLFNELVKTLATDDDQE